MDARVQAQRKLELDLRSALQNMELESDYQPIVQVSTGETTTLKLWPAGVIRSAVRFRLLTLYHCRNPRASLFRSANWCYAKLAAMRRAGRAPFVLQ